MRQWQQGAGRGQGGLPRRTPKALLSQLPSPPDLASVLPADARGRRPRSPPTSAYLSLSDAYLHSPLTPPLQRLPPSSRCWPSLLTRVARHRPRPPPAYAYVCLPQLLMLTFNPVLPASLQSLS